MKAPRCIDARDRHRHYIESRTRTRRRVSVSMLHPNRAAAEQLGFGKNHAVCFDCDSKWDNQTTGPLSGTAPVGKFAPNGFGLYDMVGNVFTWVEDCYHDNYNGAPTDGSPWSTDDCRARVVRGGSWSLPAKFIRSAYRHRTTFSDDHDYNVGFRVARTFTP